MEINPSKLNDWLNGIAPSSFHLIDCREQEEWDICHIKGARLMPLSVFEESVIKFKSSESMPFVIYCHHGIRSLHATHQMRSKGFQNSYSLAGGIERWSNDIDPTIARY